ncbi:GlcNAc transferase, partial [Archaeoglobus sp.]|uniref:GlcNAc transferase n=1 Tax=Archaeoglobus sp. TaxID=1872626 RepID=UPI0024AC6AF9
MDRFTALAIIFLATVLLAAGAIAYFFSPLFLLRLILFLAYLGVAAISAIMAGVLIYAKSKYTLPSLLSLIASLYALYQCYTWENPMHVAYITAAYILAFAFGLWWISEPDLTLYERLRSAKALENAGRYRAAARKYEKSGNYKSAAECYLKAGMEESAAWCYEKAEEFSKAAEIYEKLAAEKGDSYYWKEAYEFYKKAGEMRRAAECLERYAEDEPWFWEDVAKIYEETGDS